MNYLEKKLLHKKKYSLFSVEIFFIASTIVSFLFELFFSVFKAQRLLNLIENIFFALILIIPIYFIDNKKIRKTYFVSVFSLFTITTFIETTYYSIFNVNLTPSAIYIFFETNYLEVNEFLHFYFNIHLMAYFVLLLLILVIAISKKSIKNFYINRVFFRKRNIILSFIIISFILKFTILRLQNLPYLILKSFYVVYFESEVFNAGPYLSDEGIFRPKLISNSRDNKLFVIIIGESTTSNNMSLYGYQRETNPLLSEISDMSVYKNVISPNAGTTASISKALSLENYENSSEGKLGSIIQLLNAANYETFWISNQQPVGFSETEITKVVQASKHKFYLNTTNSEDKNLFDEVVFNKLDEVINNTSNTNKVLFIHLQGTHFFYKNRYPNSFNKFKSYDGVIATKKQEYHEIINEYDNSVLYNDYVVYSLINKIKIKNKESFVLYFSDHGEEVYNTIDFSGHNDDIGTLPMFQIPFILWQSDKFKKYNFIDINLERPYMTDDLFHSIANLCEIDDPNVDLSRSVFSKSFTKRKRIILRNKDYDSLFFRQTNNKKTNLTFK